jgi:hypothetical protein
MNPRANGQAERYVQVIKSGIRKCTSLHPDGKWWDFVPDIAWAMRSYPLKATGYSPYVVVYKH